MRREDRERAKIHFTSTSYQFCVEFYRAVERRTIYFPGILMMTLLNSHIARFFLLEIPDSNMISESNECGFLRHLLVCLSLVFLLSPECTVNWPALLKFTRTPDHKDCILTSV